MGSERRACLARALAAVAMMSAAACGRISGLDDLYLDDAGVGAAASSADASSSSTSSAASGGGGAAATTGSAGSATSAGGGGSGGVPETSYRDAVLADFPLAYWRLGEPKGSSIAQDESPNDVDGGYYGVWEKYQPGAIVGDPNSAIYFTQSCSAYPDEKGVDVGDKSALEFTGDAAFTFEVWIRPTCLVATGGQRRILEKSDLEAPAQGYQLYRRDDTGQLFFYRRGATASTYVEAPEVPPLDEWSYIAVRFDGLNLHMFVNGAWSEPKESTFDVLATTAEFRIGAASNDNFSFAGGIDEVAVYGTALSDTRILAHWNLGKGLPQ